MPNTPSCDSSSEVVADLDFAVRRPSKLQKLYPESEEAKGSYIELGEIQLTKLNSAKSALSQYQGYLRQFPKGEQVPEALLGQAQAYQAMNLGSQEKTTLQKLEALFPDSPQAASAKKRLDELGRDPEFEKKLKQLAKDREAAKETAEKAKKEKAESGGW